MLWRLVRHTEEFMVDYGILLPLRGPVAMSRFVTIAGQVKLEFYSQRNSQVITATRSSQLVGALVPENEVARACYDMTCHTTA